MQITDIKLSLLLNSVFLGVSWIVCKYGLPKLKTYRKKQKTEPKLQLLPNQKLPLLRLPLLAFKECMLSMDLNDVVIVFVQPELWLAQYAYKQAHRPAGSALNLSLCSKYTANTIKLFKRSYFQEITNFNIQFIENNGHLFFFTPTLSKKHFYYHKPPLTLAQKLVAQFLELAGCREMQIVIHDKTALENFASWGNNFEDLIISVCCTTDFRGHTIFDFVNYFKHWRRLVLTNGFDKYHFNQESISIISCEQGLINSFWKLPHRSIHFSGRAFGIDPFIRYLRRWIESSIPCTELVDFTAELSLPNYFDRILRSVKFEEVNEEWIHSSHGTIPPPSYKIKRRDKRKCALLFTFDKDGELLLGMHIF
ncbi:hypothetical protein CAEBREN_22503 [Caenorhabditis brenneri]|uniref:Uncharacterized protein n=1 Tax=Caenorhabditis brenneri TaxID=135651 RepID=G0NVN4_CAEBE|nr:hypothetical protein CAEBREN_22503 [Caenorhabditis brenneri]